MILRLFLISTNVLVMEIMVSTSSTGTMFTGPTIFPIFNITVTSIYTIPNSIISSPMSSSCLLNKV